MPLPEALATFVPLAGGLEHAHTAGIFHRDLKPSNIILTLDGPVLVDFGIAAAEQSGELTGKGHLGTLSYLPPEVFRGERAEPRKIDVYGFGLLLNEALTGVHPFPIESGLTPAAALATVGMRKLQQPALDPGEGAPEPLRDLIRRATDPDPSQRPDMGEMRRVLASLVERAWRSPPRPRRRRAAPARVPAWSPPPGCDHARARSGATRRRRVRFSDDFALAPPFPRAAEERHRGLGREHDRRRPPDRARHPDDARTTRTGGIALPGGHGLAVGQPRAGDERGRQHQAGGPRQPAGPQARPRPRSARRHDHDATTPAPVVSVSPRPSPRPSPSAVATPAPRPPPSPPPPAAAHAGAERPDPPCRRPFRVRPA